jgi:hypothetical protein
MGDCGGTSSPLIIIEVLNGEFGGLILCCRITFAEPSNWEDDGINEEGTVNILEANSPIGGIG